MPDATPCVVQYPIEERWHTQTYLFNRRYTSEGVINRWGQASRSVNEVTILVRGEKEAVRNAVDAMANSSYRDMRHVAGPWWEATVTTVIYGEWETRWLDEDGGGANGS